jgi:dephospho-CoA kinase
MNLIGISGTNGSGKDLLGQILASKHGFMFISASDMLRDELSKRGLPLARKNAAELSAEWRRKNGLGVIVDKALAIYNLRSDQFKGLTIGSIRNPGEADRIHELGGKVVWIDASPKIRFERIQANGATRGIHRSADDNKTFEQFLAEEEIEMHPSGDETTLDMSAVKLKADLFIENNSSNVVPFLEKIKNSLSL